jgi:hypothetical protein
MKLIHQATAVTLMAEEQQALEAFAGSRKAEARVRGSYHWRPLVCHLVI